MFSTVTSRLEVENFYSFLISISYTVVQKNRWHVFNENLKQQVLQVERLYDCLYRTIHVKLLIDTFTFVVLHFNMTIDYYNSYSTYLKEVIV